MQSIYPSLFPAQLGSYPLSSAQQQYLHCIAQEATRLSASILDMRRRQQQWSKQMLTAEPEACRYLISLIQLAQSEYDLLHRQWQLLSSSVSSTVDSWKAVDARQPHALLLQP